jgi:hypothetical protein
MQVLRHQHTVFLMRVVWQLNSRARPHQDSGRGAGLFRRLPRCLAQEQCARLIPRLAAEFFRECCNLLLQVQRYENLTTSGCSPQRRP